MDGQHKWETKVNRKTIADLKSRKEIVDKNEKLLMAKYIDEEHAAMLGASNIVIKCVTACNKSHDGPYTAAEELSDLAQKWKESGSVSPL